MLYKENASDNQIRIKFLKLGIRMFFIHYSVSKSRERKYKNVVLENKFKVFKQDLEKNGYSKEYLDCKRKLNVIFDWNVESVIIRSKCFLKLRVQKWKNKKK